jgi:23S rRNA (pseudouridine1915-N3)-methyltransferase
LRWKIVSVGKPRLAFAKDGITEYLTRLRCFCPVDVEIAKATDPEREGRQLLQLSEGCFRLVLDERGQLLTSRALADEVGRIENEPKKTCAVIVGGADGLSPMVREKADKLWSLSPLTLQHEMALLFTLEQLYRAHTIRAGLPYHRD